MATKAKTSENSHIVRLQITCVTPPQCPPDTTEVEFGLQDRHEVIHPGQLQLDGSLQYEIDVVVIHQPATPSVRWRGPYVHGTPAAPFLYLSLRRLSSIGGLDKKAESPSAQSVMESSRIDAGTPLLCCLDFWKWQWNGSTAE
jgi:hypothetical protein